MSIAISNDTLPHITRHAIWHPTSGLVVSPFNRTLPDAIADRTKPSKTRDYHFPRLLGDADIYLAFFPRTLPHSNFFAALALSPDELFDRIVPIANDVGYMLEAKTMDAWIDLEDALLSIIRTLMETHELRQHFPEITWPPWPAHTGYREAHKDKAAVLKSARYAKRAFIALSACATFAISLWLDDNEYLCFNRAWNALTSRKKDPIPRPFLDSLQDSVVCNLESGFRPGGFVSPYFTRWGRFMKYFVRARVPIWFLWGFEKDYTSDKIIDHDMKINYLPPKAYIEVVKVRQAIYAAIVLPHKVEDAITIAPDVPVPRTSPPIHLPNHPLSTSNEPWQTRERGPWSSETAGLPLRTRDPRLESGSGQRPGENWESFSQRAHMRYLARIAKETDKEKQSRLSREENAARQNLSKTSTVYAWEKDENDPTFYRRTYVNKDSAASYFADYYPYQRFYWGHTNEWDLVPQVKAPPGVVVPDLYGSYDNDDDDDDYEGLSSHVRLDISSQEVLGASDPPTMDQTIQNTMQMVTAVEPVEAFEPPSTPRLQEYLHHRHGYIFPDHESWNMNLHDRGNSFMANETHKAVGILLFSGVNVPPPHSTSIVDCVNVMRNDRLRYTDLTASWDIRQQALTLNMNTVYLQYARMDGRTVYILRPPRNSTDDSRWYVALSSHTAVLLVYRKGWVTMLEIARGLLGLGVPFRTVVEDTQPPPKFNWNQKSRGLGIRPKGYRLTRWDYDAYLRSRNVILNSATGRAIRLCGGLVGRIASEVVPDARVLDGPVLCDDIVARSGDTYFLDDGVSDETLDRVSGVYHIYVNDGKYCVVHASWWPKHDIFMASGRFSDQWLPDSEKFYGDWTQGLANGVFNYKSASEWRTELKYRRVQNNNFINGSERLAKQFLRESSRAL